MARRSGRIHGGVLTVETMAIDQYGQTYHNLGAHPRKALLERLGYKKAQRMWIDTKSGEPRHIGYIIGGYWLTLYKVTQWQG